eukprot:586218-Hanusia_phi.AAC.3
MQTGGAREECDEDSCAPPLHACQPPEHAQAPKSPIRAAGLARMPLVEHAGRLRADADGVEHLQVQGVLDFNLAAACELTQRTKMVGERRL